MENEEIMMTNNEEVVDLVPIENETEETSGNGLKVAVGVGVAGLVGVILYKKVISPFMAKRKAAKEAKAAADLVDATVPTEQNVVGDETNEIPVKDEKKK